MKLYLATFSPAMTDSSKKLYRESFAMRKYAMHGVRRSAGSCTNTGTQFPRFSWRMIFSIVGSGGYGINVLECRQKWISSNQSSECRSLPEGPLRAYSSQEDRSADVLYASVSRLECRTFHGN